MGAPIALAWSGSGARAAGLIAALFFWWGAGQGALAATFVDYLYVEANEGDSSGGHVAISFGNETFHFQHESPGILRIQRQETAAFRHIYGMLGNRAIRTSRITVSEDTYTLLRDAFVRLLMVQDAQVEIRDALHRDVALIDLMLRQRRAPQPNTGEILLTLTGLGYFLPDAPSQLETARGGIVKKEGAGTVSPALASLRDRIRVTYGEGFITERVTRARARLRGMEPLATRKPLPAVTRDRFPVSDAAVSTRYEETLHAIFALELLQAALPLREGTFWTPDGDDFRLEPAEALALKEVAVHLENDLVRLADSPRQDWGIPFVVGMARLTAIEASLASGHLVLLDIFPPDDQLPHRHDAALRPYLPRMKNETREVFLQKRKQFFTAGGFREADYAVLERSGNLLLNIDRAMATGTPLRAVPKSPFPALAAKLSVPQPGAADDALLERELAAAQTAERDYAAALGRLYAYNLFRHNCVTEIFSIINSALASKAPGRETEEVFPASTRAESVRRLGGFVDAEQGLAFIPFVSAGAVERSYAVVETREDPSCRTARLAEMKMHEAPLKVFLRESNTITSSVYRLDPDDSDFLFFTDDTVLLRPLFGAFNLLTGLGKGLLGVVTMPVEGPERLVSGARGMLFSFPELVFVNLRKGSMAYVEKSAEPRSN